MRHTTKRDSPVVSILALYAENPRDHATVWEIFHGVSQFLQANIKQKGENINHKEYIWYVQTVNRSNVIPFVLQPVRIFHQATMNVMIQISSIAYKQAFLSFIKLCFFGET
jgi:hypothetical protein